MTDKNALERIYRSFFTLPERPAAYSPDDYLSLETCIAKVDEAVGRLVETGAIVPGTAEYAYYMCHKHRFALTLARIPKAREGETVCEVGSCTIFSALLHDLLGYSDIYGIDRRNQPDTVTVQRRRLLGKEYEQKLVNVDLNDIREVSLPKFSKIFFFEVLEHLHKPMQAFHFFKTCLETEGELYLSQPNGASTFCLQKLFQMFSPMLYPDFNDTVQDSHFREFTPLTLKYALIYAGFQELSFETLYIHCDVSPSDPINKLYPFQNDSETNYRLRGDLIFSVSRSSGDFICEHPDLLYNFDKFSPNFYAMFPQFKDRSYFLPKQWMQSYRPPALPPAGPAAGELIPLSAHREMRKAAPETKNLAGSRGAFGQKSAPLLKQPVRRPE